MSADHIHFFLQLRNEIKLHHWQTHIYARHIATDNVLKSLEKLIDSFVEIYIGKYGRPRITGKNAELTLHNLSEPGIVRVINAAIKIFTSVLNILSNSFLFFNLFNSSKDTLLFIRISI